MHGNSLNFFDDQKYVKELEKLKLTHTVTAEQPQQLKVVKGDSGSRANKYRKNALNTIDDGMYIRDENRWNEDVAFANVTITTTVATTSRFSSFTSFFNSIAGKLNFFNDKTSSTVKLSNTAIDTVASSSSALPSLSFGKEGRYQPNISAVAQRSQSSMCNATTAAAYGTIINSDKVEKLDVLTFHPLSFDNNEPNGTMVLVNYDVTNVNSTITGSRNAAENVEKLVIDLVSSDEEEVTAVADRDIELNSDKDDTHSIITISSDGSSYIDNDDAYSQLELAVSSDARDNDYDRISSRLQSRGKKRDSHLLNVKRKKALAEMGSRQRKGRLHRVNEFLVTRFQRKAREMIKNDQIVICCPICKVRLQVDPECPLKSPVNVRGILYCGGCYRLKAIATNDKGLKDIINWLKTGQFPAEESEKSIDLGELHRAMVRRSICYQNFQLRRHRQLPFNITPQRLYELCLKSNLCCAISNQPVLLGQGKFYSITIDHILPKRDAHVTTWTMGNLQVMSYLFNNIKGCYSNEETIRYHRQLMDNIDDYVDYV
ncbi:hypothetical protein BDF20DRAFT_899989 [Mycotypha africana]|uniref:uncharacterized protein n=1 Tax=Mycotypha africana TaxID=64632 RepID=UPI002301609D|nr:uncharacterized protein BDF20DRAFT_899989 [Mycotypha africana]KAI8967560.1 hypothetical protein BDF20DRAFT_899989 [Mycotypha africana]